MRFLGLIHTPWCDIMVKNRDTFLAITALIKAKQIKFEKPAESRGEPDPKIIIFEEVANITQEQIDALQSLQKKS